MYTKVRDGCETPSYVRLSFIPRSIIFDGHVTGCQFSFESHERKQTEIADVISTWVATKRRFFLNEWNLYGLHS